MEVKIENKQEFDSINRKIKAFAPEWLENVPLYYDDEDVGTPNRYKRRVRSMSIWVIVDAIQVFHFYSEAPMGLTYAEFMKLDLNEFLVEHNL